MYSIRSLDRAALTFATLLIAACQAEPAVENGAKSQPPASAGNAVETNRDAAVGIAPALEPAAQRYRFTGTEPFWGGTIDGSTIVYRTPDDIDGEAIAATLSKVGSATRYSSTLDGQPFILTLTPGTCSDGMSDTVYPISAALSVQGEERRGCATPVVGAGAADSSQTPPEEPTP